MAKTCGKHRAQGPRSIHLIDLENLVSGDVSPDRVRAAWHFYARRVGIQRNDSVLVAVSRKNAATAAFNIPSNVVRVIGEDIKDGADIALVEAIDVRHVATRFGRVYIGSGDHYFAGIARELKVEGCAVVQVLGAGLCSAELYRACSASIRLTDLIVRRTAEYAQPKATRALVAV